MPTVLVDYGEYSSRSAECKAPVPKSRRTRNQSAATAAATARACAGSSKHITPTTSPAGMTATASDEAAQDAKPSTRDSPGEPQSGGVRATSTIASGVDAATS